MWSAAKVSPYRCPTTRPRGHRRTGWCLRPDPTCRSRWSRSRRHRRTTRCRRAGWRVRGLLRRVHPSGGAGAVRGASERVSVGRRGPHLGRRLDRARRRRRSDRCRSGGLDDLKSLPVLLHDRVVGVISRRALLHALATRDQRIRSGLNALLRAESKDWCAEVRDGVATVTGPVDDDQRRIAEALAGTVPGVIAVQVG